MGFLDDARKKLTQAVDKHGDKIDRGIDQAARTANRRTKGKYADQAGRGAGKAREALDKLDDRKGPPPAGGPRR